MTKFTQLLKIHFFIIILAVIVGVVMYLPQYLLTKNLQDDYKGIYFSVSDSEMYYAGRIHDIFDGHYKLANAFLYEYKDLPYIQPALPEILTAGLGSIFFWISIPAKIFISTRIVVPIMLTFLLYLFTFRFTRSKVQALVVTAVIVFGLEFLQNFSLVFSFFNNSFFNNRTLDFTRPISPQFGVVFLVLYMIFFWEWLKNGSKKMLALSGLVLGASVYIYFYTWSFLLASNGVLFFYFLVSDRKKAWELAKMHLIFLVLSIPYLINLYQFYLVPNHEFLAYHAGQFPSRRFIMNWTVIGGLILSIISFFRKSKIKFWWFSSLFLAGFVALNQQLITGQELTPAHFHWYFISTIAGIISVIFLLNLVNLKNHKLSKCLITIFIVTGLTGYAFAKHVHSYQYYREGFEVEQRYGELYAWLDENTPKDSVVLLSDRNRADQMTAYTHNNAMYSSFMFLSNTPTERLSDMHNLNIFLKGVRDQDIETYLKNNPSVVANFIGGFSTRRTKGCRTCFEETEYQTAADSYRRFLNIDLSVILSRYRLDYVVNDKKNDVWAASDIPDLQHLQDVGDFMIYEYTIKK